MTKPGELQFQRVALEGLERLSELHEACFGVSVNSEYFKWKYLGNPAGNVLAWEAVDPERNGKVAAFYGLIPEFYLLNGKKIKVYQSMDTMTHPEYRNRGLFIKLANLTYNHVVESEGSLTMVGIPGMNSLHGFLKRLDWKCISHHKFFFVHKAWFRARDLFKLKGNSGIEFKPITGETPELARYFQNRNSATKPISPYLTQEFFAWRVFRNIYRSYKVLGAYQGGELVGICTYGLDPKGRVYIYFLEFINAALTRKHTQALIRKIFDLTKTSSVYTWEPTTENLRETLLSCGFLKNDFSRGPFSYRVPQIARSQPGIIDGVDWLDIRNYDVQPLMQD